MVWMIFTFLFRDWCCDSLPRPWGSTSGLCCVLANGQSSCEGSQAPHGSDRRFLRDECQSSSSHGVRGNLDLHLSLPFPSGLGVIGGVGSLSTGSPSGRGSGYLGLMYSQAPVRSYTKDRAGLQGDHTPKGGVCRPHSTQVVAYRCLSVFCGGKGTAPGCAPRGSPKVPSGALKSLCGETWQLPHTPLQTCLQKRTLPLILPGQLSDRPGLRSRCQWGLLNHQKLVLRKQLRKRTWQQNPTTPLPRDTDVSA